jgi:hypothetical protein
VSPWIPPYVYEGAGGHPDQGVIPYEQIPAHLAQVRAFEAELAERMAYVEALMRHDPMLAVRARREARIAACDPSSGRIAMGQSPENWRQ